MRTDSKANCCCSYVAGSCIRSVHASGSVLRSYNHNHTPYLIILSLMGMFEQQVTPTTIAQTSSGKELSAVGEPIMPGVKGYSSTPI
ncbi:hypothetical protein BO83DRAFT_102957 [Aspergillus eucalypticola CBS 122712]|uniref:Uncharacterized protein n=1 Tax=Aspergillus eucalypticola (strain CBS 122712 / IBT 29274) TaxID=1448314 RepID=A0A317V1G8_ASPEC|nr:uncharacterized protein BO83DRAFT_102957 [Aspergillus eucalypticola CBS 122712]PWY66928.1 hypothetical protein BO83DRAFT_102957 [Aspergillus eucalypticola CBS 122712]